MAPTEKFGIWKFNPNCLQCCASIKVFTVVYSISALMTSTLGVYVASQITTLEKQFGFTSTQSGLIMSCNDIGYLTITLIVSYFAERVHIPRSLSLCTVLFGLSGIICAIPYFISPMYSQQQVAQLSNYNSSMHQTSMFESVMSSGQLCEKSTDMTSQLMNKSNNDLTCLESNQRPTVGVATSFTPLAMSIIAIGMICQGFAKSPRQAYIAIYIDNNVDKTQTAVYVGSIMAVAIFGPAIGFGLGGYFSQIYVTLEDVSISPRDPRWIGAWWVGFLTFGIGSILSALPVMCFPKRFKQKPVVNEDGKTVKKRVYIAADFFKSTFGLFRNKLFVLIVIGRCLILIVVSGSLAFGPKYMESQFTLPAWKSNILMGVLRIVSAAVGTFAGGYLTSKKKLSPISCCKVVLGISCVSIIYYILSLFIGCETPEIIGLNKNAVNSSDQCSATCNCQAEKYFPVCGSDNQNYYSPCYAGCQGKSLQGFRNCTCIGQEGFAKPGLCASNCQMLIPYMIISTVFGLVETIAVMPGFIFMLRSVKEKDKGIAIASSAFITTLLGWFLGPVIFGEIIDMCCKIWSSRCGVKGSCALYDNVNFRYAIFGFGLGMRCAVFIIDIIIFLFARKKTDWTMNDNIKENNQISEKDVFPEKENLILKANYVSDNDNRNKTHNEGNITTDIKETPILT